MQEEVENKTVTLAINTTKMTARALKNAIMKYLTASKQKSRASPAPQGKQSVKKLKAQGFDVSNIEITSDNIKSFERFARQYNVDYALKKVSGGKIPQYLVFFKARNEDAITSAFKKYMDASIKREKKPSVLATLRRLKALMKPSPNKDKKKELER